jgi:3-phenylpropionate/trans-cinnamate dioxygenase ferredoxin subunit
MSESGGKPGMVDVGAVESFPIGRGKRVLVEGNPVALFRLGGKFHALEDCCSHAMAPLSGGEVKGNTVACPRHGAHFDITTGEVRSLQAVANVVSFPVEVREGRVLVSTQGWLADPLWVSGRHLGETEAGSDQLELEVVEG